MIDFTQVYQLPLKNQWGMVHSKNNIMSINFFDKVLSPDSFTINEHSQNVLIDVINGNDRKIDVHLILKNEDGTIYIESPYGVRKEFMLIRGWGYLTGIGGLNLKEDVAIKIMDDFANFIIKRINQAMDAN